MHLKSAGTLTQESQTKRDNLVNQIRTIELEGFEFWKKTYSIPAVGDDTVEDDKPVEPDQPVSTPTVETEIPVRKERVPEQPDTAPSH